MLISVEVGWNKNIVEEIMMSGNNQTSQTFNQAKGDDVCQSFAR